MKKQLDKTKTNADDILPEYDFRHGSPNKYAAKYVAGSAVVVLDPDVAAAFPTASEVNTALRELLASKAPLARHPRRTS